MSDLGKIRWFSELELIKVVETIAGPDAAVEVLNTFEPPEPTTVELLQEVGQRISDYRTGLGQSEAGRQMAIAATALEDTTMRFTRGMAEMKGVRKDYDFERER